MCFTHLWVTPVHKDVALGSARCHVFILFPLELRSVRARHTVWIRAEGSEQSRLWRSRAGGLGEHWPQRGRGLLGVTPAWGAQRSNTEPQGVGTGGREVKKHQTMAGGQGQGETGRGGGGRCRGTSRERHSTSVPSAGGQRGHSTGPSGRRGTARSPGSCRAPGCPSLGITQHITHFWAVLAAPHGIVTQMI